MFDTKPNALFKFVFSLTLVLGLSNCTQKESLTFQKQNFATDSLLNCKNIDCASIEINLLKSIDNTSVAKTINQEIEKVVCDVLNIGEETTITSMKQAVAMFNDSYTDMHKEFPDETVPYEASIDCDLTFQCENLISIIMDSYVFTGGAHGYGGVSFINVNTKTGKRISNKELFKDYTQFEDFAEKAFRTQHNIPKEASINSTGLFFENDTFSLPENIGFTDTEMILYYNPYEISSYAEGPIEIKFNKEDISSYCALNIL